MVHDWILVYHHGDVGRASHVSKTCGAVMAFRLTNISIFNVGLQDGGPAGLVYGFLFCWAGYTAVVASLAELVSVVPTAGGQYHWTFELAPPKYRKFVSYITGEWDGSLPRRLTDLSQAGKLSAHGKPISQPSFTLEAQSFKA